MAPSLVHLLTLPSQLITHNKDNAGCDDEDKVGGADESGSPKVCHRAVVEL